MLRVTIQSTRYPFAGRRRGRAAPVFMAALALFAALPASADICKYLDQEGTVHYSNLPPEKGWKRVSCSDGGDAAPQKRTGPAEGGTARQASSPMNFPRVEASVQRGRDDVRRRVLQDELATEEKLLAEARSSYADGAPPPLPDERANVDKYRERIGKLRQILSVHQKNVDALKKEIASIK